MERPGRNREYSRKLQEKSKTASARTKTQWAVTSQSAELAIMKKMQKKQ